MPQISEIAKIRISAGSEIGQDPSLQRLIQIMPTENGNHSNGNDSVNNGNSHLVASVACAAETANSHANGNKDNRFTNGKTQSWEDKLKATAPLFGLEATTQLNPDGSEQIIFKKPAHPASNQEPIIIVGKPSKKHKARGILIPDKPTPPNRLNHATNLSIFTGNIGHTMYKNGVVQNRSKGEKNKRERKG
ncbi:MAG: hypothetical protein A2857_05725 [Candidatus Levybacteria bacterium RIFCSPHIGHO2_01_FULL_36_15]|nr:MAG: hypothetical protein A2857_05725 [Candidatus Levybacteria bacterium RIFCSPHIGHO2_01_FULL_36_15]OGH38399.1 MAG: hypothetical protein A2905_00525 [Candidatus Levybacteria bacterium RIFCSPLOWO2_01_FULL_36_10]